MSRRSRDARTLAQLLAAETGVSVEVRWNSSHASAHRAGRWAWHVGWSDGPTLDAMRAAAERLAADLPGVDAEQLVYQRIVQPGAWALAMVRNVRLGQPALSHHGSTAELGLALDRESYPERGSAEDRAMAGRLVRLAGGLEHRMAEILDAHGLAALTGDLAPTGNLVPLRRPTSVRTGD